MPLLLLAILLCLCLPGVALAVDAHGPAVAPGAAGDVTLPSEGVGKGGFNVGLMAEAADAPLYRTVVDGEDVVTETLLDDVFGVTLTGIYGVTDRLGLAVSLPYWASASVRTAEDASSFSTIGDLRLYAPIVLLPQRQSGFSVAIHPELVLPTGAEDLLLGSHGLGAGLTLAGGLSRERLGFSANLGGSLSPGATFSNLDQRHVLGTSASAWVNPTPAWRLGAETWLKHGFSDLPENTPAEAGLWSRISLPVTQLHLGISSALTGGATAAQARFYLGLSWSGRPPAAPVFVPDAPVAVASSAYDVAVVATDAAGKPVDAAVTATGPGPAITARTGASGKATLHLSPGAWEVRLAEDGYATESRQMMMEEGRFRAASIDAVMIPASGTGVLDLTVIDGEGNPLPEGRVALDGVDLGTVGTGGRLRVENVATGGEVQVSAPDFLPVAPVPFDQANLFLTMERPPGSVKVITRGLSGVVADAMVRFTGPETKGPLAVGETGERTFVLKPGNWTATVSAGSFGIQQRKFVVEPNVSTLVRIDVVLQPEVGRAELSVRVGDVDGRPVTAAEVKLDGKPVGATGNGGALELLGLSPGEHLLEVSAKHFRPTTPETVLLVEGRRDVAVSLQWLPGSVRVRVRGPDGPVPGTMARFTGPTTMPPLSLDPSGERLISLEPGTWKVGISSPDLGVQQRTVVVEPESEHLLTIDAVLFAKEGEGTVEVQVRDAAGNPVDAARVVVDGNAVGTTSTGGTLSVSGLRLGAQKVEVESEFFKIWSADVNVSAESRVQVPLDWLPGVVRLQVETPEGTPADCLARFYGQRSLPPVRVGADGERLFALGAGRWRLVVSSERYRLAQVDMEVKGESTPQPVKVRLEPPPLEVAELSVLLVDADGGPVNGTVTLTTSEADRQVPAVGAALFSGLPVAPVRLKIVAEGFEAVDLPKVELVPGAQVRRVELPWLPRKVAVNVRTDAGRTVDAEVAFLGPANVANVRTGADGDATMTLRPGRWSLLVTAPGLGAHREELPLAPGTATVTLPIVLSEPRVTVTTAQVVIDEQIRFDFNDDRIRPESLGVLEEVATTLLLNPALRVEVQGHTDDVGIDAYNLELSERRAEAVRRYLVGRGVEAVRLTAKGYGTTVPLAPNTTEAGRSRNRRVQFVILSG